MPKPIILFADNDDDFLKTRAEFLRQEGYHVIEAANSTEARQRLEAGGIDLAILDIRLENDDNERDLSGLFLAKEMADRIPTIVTSGFLQELVPTIILTGFPSYEAVREALAPRVGGLPAAVDFVAKQEGPEALLVAIRRALSASKRRQAEILASEAGIVETQASEAEMLAPPERGRELRKMLALIGAFASLVLGAGMGIGAVITGDPRLLLGTFLFAFLMVASIIAWVSME